MFKIGTNKLEKEVYMQKISRNRYKLMKICTNTGKYKKNISKYK